MALKEDGKREVWETPSTGEEKSISPWPAPARWVGHRPVHEKGAGSALGQGVCLLGAWTRSPAPGVQEAADGCYALT